jgi:osmoprotectant transport system permease protein
VLPEIVEIWQRYDLTARTIEHLTMFFIALALAIAIGIALGIILYRQDGVANLVLNVLNILETFPDLALLVLLMTFIGLGAGPTIVACVVYSILPVARNAYTGLHTVSPDQIDVATALGLTDREILISVRLPLSLPLIAGGIRISVVFTMGIVTLGGLIGAGGLGAPLVTGVFTIVPEIIFVAGLWVGVLAIILDGVAGFVERRLKRRYGQW